MVAISDNKGACRDIFPRPNILMLPLGHGIFSRDLLGGEGSGKGKSVRYRLDVPSRCEPVAQALHTPHSHFMFDILVLLYVSSVLYIDRRTPERFLPIFSFETIDMTT